MAGFGVQLPLAYTRGSDGTRGELGEKHVWTAGIFRKIHYVSFAFFASSREMDGT
jgi:hypothetical protein